MILKKLRVNDYLLLVVTVIYLFILLGKRLVELQNYYNVISFSVFVLVALFVNPRNFVNVFRKKKYIYLLFFIMFIFVTGLVSGNIISTIKYEFGILIIFSPVIIYDVSKTRNRYFRTLLFYLSFLLLLYYSIMTLIAVATYPTISRQIASGTDYIMYYYYGLNIGGGYSLIYSLVFAVLGLIYLAKDVKINLSIRILLIFVFIYTMFMSGYFTALFLVLFGIIIRHFGKTKYRLLIGVSFLGAILLILYIFRVNVYIGNYIILNSNIGLYGVKLQELGSFLIGDTTNSYVNFFGRASRMMLSLNTFADNPVIGFSIVTGYDSLKEIGYIGQHCEWLDAFARYGIIGTFFLGGFIMNVIKEVYGKIDKGYVLIIVFIALGFLDPILNSSIIFAFVLLSYYYSEKRE